MNTVAIEDILPSEIERFWTHVQRQEGCWLWTSSLNKHNGYGRWRPRHKARYIRVHKIAWFLYNGPIPDGMCVCHHCDVRHCVNPEHLFLGTVYDNNRDCCHKLRHAHGESHWCSKLREQDINRILYLNHRGWSLPKIAALFEVTPQAIWYVVKQKTWRHLKRAI